MLAGLQRDHLGRSCFYYLDVTMDETLRRHAMRPQAAEFGPDDMRSWYRPRDLLSSIREHIIPQTSTLQQTVEVILGDTQVLAAIPKDYGHESSRHQIGYRADVVTLLRVVGQAVGPDEAAPNTAVSDHHPLP